MCAVESTNSFNYFDFPPVAQQSAERRSAAVQHHYFGTLNIPSMLNLFYAPSDIAESVIDQVHSEKTADMEGSRDNCLRLIESPFNIVSSGFSNIEIITTILSYFNVSSAQFSVLTSLLKKVPILGLIICGFEVLMEGSGMKRAMALRSALSLPDSSLKGQELSSAQIMSLLSLYKEYCHRDEVTISLIEDLVQRKFPALTAQERVEKVREYETLAWGAKDRQLIRRLFPRCAQEVQEKVPQLLRNMATGNFIHEKEWRLEAKELLSDVKMQLNKKMVMHVMGLLAIALTIAALIAVLCACPYVIPLVLIIVSSVFSTVRCAIDIGMMDTKGYHFVGSNFIPNCLKPSCHKIANWYHRTFTQSTLPEGGGTMEYSLFL